MHAIIHSAVFYSRSKYRYTHRRLSVFLLYPVDKLYLSIGFEQKQTEEQQQG